MPDNALAGCYVISLRPAGQHAALRRAAARHGARMLALSPWTLAQADDEATRTALRAALACARVVATSPNAVRAAAALQPLRMQRGQAWYAVGSSTARALRRAGIAEVLSPSRVEAIGRPAVRIDSRRDTCADDVRMDSEGLLALPGLQDVRDAAIGLLTAPGGRGLIERELRARGARVLRADVYARRAIAFHPRALAALRALAAPAWLALSSGDALDQALARLPADGKARLLAARVAAASPRLASMAREAGFATVVVAASARPGDMVAAMASTASASMPGIAHAPGPVV